MKKLEIFILAVIFLLTNSCLYAQYDKFYIGMGVYDFDSVSNTVALGTDPAIGCDFEYLKDLSDYGFNLILPYHQLLKNPTKWAVNNPSTAFLDRAISLGLKVILNCPEINIDKANPDFNQTNCNVALNYYGPHPALIGWHIIDEPNVSAHFKFIEQYANSIASYDSTKLIFTNLFPNYASNDQLFGDGSDGWPNSFDYEYYIDCYLSQTNANFLSVDHYPIWFNTLNYFTNLEIVARKANEYNVPYFIMFSPANDWLISSYEGKTLEEFKYVIYANLIYGSKGLFYWAREGQTGCGNSYNSICSSSAIIGSDRWDIAVESATKNYFKNLHFKILKVGNILFSLEYKSAYHVSSNSTIVPGETEQLQPSSLWSMFNNDLYAKDIFDISDPLQSQNGSKIENIVISFLTDEINNKYFWIFNKSLVDDEYIQLNFAENTALINILDNKIYQEAKSRVVYLEPAEAKLFMIKN